jgi:hypothetical protein
MILLLYFRSSVAAASVATACVRHSLLCTGVTGTEERRINQERFKGIVRSNAFRSRTSELEANMSQGPNQKDQVFKPFPWERCVEAVTDQFAEKERFLSHNYFLLNRLLLMPSSFPGLS